MSGQKDGHWITTDSGRHVFIEDGKGTVEEQVRRYFARKGGKSEGKPAAAKKAKGAGSPKSKETPKRSTERLAPEKAKFVGARVGKDEHVYAEKQEKAIARAVGGKQLADNEPLDVRVKSDDGEHAIEVKTLLKGTKTQISVHDDALIRKVDYAATHKGTTFHAVAIDHRHKYEGGEHRGNYSGHDLYYKRGAGRYALSQMHRVSSKEELATLVQMRDDELPVKARGSLPSGDAVRKLRESAEKAHAARVVKDRERKRWLRAQQKGATP